mgnify:CR=1 FL=1
MALNDQYDIVVPEGVIGTEVVRKLDLAAEKLAEAYALLRIVQSVDEEYSTPNRSILTEALSLIKEINTALTAKARELGLEVRGSKVAAAR